MEGYGNSKGMKVKSFYDHTDGDVEQKLNKFFKENTNIEVLDIKYTNTYFHDIGMHGTERALLVYRELNNEKA
jgi:hypothetical protein